MCDQELEATVFLDQHVYNYLSRIKEKSSFHLFGINCQSNTTRLVNIFGCKEILADEKKPNSPKLISLIGCAILNNDKSVLISPLSSSIYLLIDTNPQPSIKNVLYHNQKCQLTVSNTIIFDSNKLLSSELFRKWSKLLDENNECFLFLQNSLQLYQKRCPLLKRMQIICSDPPLNFEVINKLSQPDACNVTVSKISSKFHFSTTIQHLCHRSSQLMICTRFIQNRRDVFRSKNTLSSIVFDVFLGTLLILFITTFFNTSKCLEWGFSKMDKLADSVEELIKILIAMPAGLKLNRPLNTALGTFFLYHIHIWKTYIVLLKPILTLIFDVVAFSALFGASFMFALLSDLISVATVHIYCFYGYAARLHAFQISGLISLWRLFRGKKWNNLKRRVDSHQYGSDQLFIGSVCFTTLFFLSPTILLYYVVFFTLRIAILSIQFTIKLVIKCLVRFPIYGIVSWILGAPCTLNHCKFSLINHTQNNLIIALSLQSMSFTQLFASEQHHCHYLFANDKKSDNVFVSLIKGNLL